MSSDNAILRESDNNVFAFPNRHNKARENPDRNLVQDDFSASRCGPHKQDIDVGRKVGNKTPDAEFTHHNYPSEYSSWRNMKQRCRKGLGVLDPRFEEFPDFIKHMDPKPSKNHTIDRNDREDPTYSPENCSWEDKTQQTQNRINTRMLEDGTGTCLPIAEWSIRVGLSAKTIAKRIDSYDWPVHEAIHRRKGYQFKKNQVRKYQAAKHPSASCDELVNLHERNLREVHKQPFIPMLAKHKHMLIKISRHLELGGIPALPALALVYDEWTEFRAYADKKYGTFNPPEIPTTEYLFRALSAIGNFYLEHLDKVREEQERERQRQAEVEVRQLSLEKEERRAKFINQYLLSNPDYKQMHDRIDYLRQYEHDPRSGINPEDYIHYFRHMARILPEAESEEVLDRRAANLAVQALSDRSRSLAHRIWRHRLIDTEEEIRGFLEDYGLQTRAEEEWIKQENSTD